MKSYLFFPCCAILAFLSACHPPQKEKPVTLAGYFSEKTAPDTLVFEVPENDETPSGDTIPTSYFFSQFETRLMNTIQYFDNSEKLVVLGQARFLLNGQEAYQTGLRQSWYKHQSLFLFNPAKKAFTDRVTVAEFYGGDSGQVLTGSWLFDFDGDGDKDIVRREIQHWIDVTKDEPLDTMAEFVSLLLWQDGQFSPATVEDSAAMIKRFPINSFW